MRVQPTLGLSCPCTGLCWSSLKSLTGSDSCLMREWDSQPTWSQIAWDSERLRCRKRRNNEWTKSKPGLIKIKVEDLSTKKLAAAQATSCSWRDQANGTVPLNLLYWRARNPKWWFSLYCVKSISLLLWSKWFHEHFDGKISFRSPRTDFAIIYPQLRGEIMAHWWMGCCSPFFFPAFPPPPSGHKRSFVSPSLTCQPECVCKAQSLLADKQWLLLCWGSRRRMLHSQLIKGVSEKGSFTEEMCSCASAGEGLWNSRMTVPPPLISCSLIMWCLWGALMPC